MSKGDVLLSLSKCSHTTLMKDMCAQCGMDLRKIEEEKSSSTARVQNKANIAMVHSIPELKVSSDVS